MRIFSVTDRAGREWAVQSQSVMGAIEKAKALGADEAVEVYGLPPVMTRSLGDVCDAMASSLSDLNLSGPEADAREPVRLVWRERMRGYDLLRKVDGDWRSSLSHGVPASMAPR